jgi:hypothetical protein
MAEEYIGIAMKKNGSYNAHFHPGSKFVINTTPLHIKEFALFFGRTREQL